MKKVAIVGAGISGLSAGKLLAELGVPSIIYNKSDYKLPGGLISCSLESGSLYHRVGGHVFNSKNRSVLQWFWKHFNQGDEFLSAQRNAVILLEDQIIPYPIELNIAALGRDLGSKIIRELAILSSKSTSKEIGNTPLCFKDFLLLNFGQTLCDLYFFPYNEKIWQTDLSAIPIEWLQGKLPMMEPSQILEGNIFKSSDNMVHSTFFYPRVGGSQFIADRLAQKQSLTYESIFSIDIADSFFSINGTTACFTSVIYTGDIRSLQQILSPSILSRLPLTESDWEAVSSLSSNSTTTMLCHCDETPYSWMYIPSKCSKIHRIIYTGNFSPSNNSLLLPPGRITCTVEHSGHLSVDQMTKEIEQLPFSMTPIAYNYCSSSYILHSSSSRELVSRLKANLSAIGIFLCGRFAEWEYYNMDAAIESSMSISQCAAYFKS